jgi:hypothetical protein
MDAMDAALSAFAAYVRATAPSTGFGNKECLSNVKLSHNVYYLRSMSV